MFWRPIPFIRLLVPYIFGVITMMTLQNQLKVFPIVISFLASLSTLLILNKKKVHFQRRWLFGCLLFINLFLFGGIRCFFHNELNLDNHFSKFIDKENFIIGQVKAIHETAKYLRLSIKVNAVYQIDKTIIESNGNLLVYLPISNHSRAITLGDQLNFKAEIYPIPKAKNPKAFDFSRYMHTQNVHYQTFVDEDEWQMQRFRSTPNLKTLAYEVQQYCLSILRNYLSGDNEYAVAAALILGDKSNIDRTLKNAYAKTGAMHVLAVSGLHVGLIYAGIAFVFALVSIRSLHWRFLKVFTSLAIIWMFAFITGGSSSVLRASVMFSFFTVGKEFNRNSNIYNILGASAFTMLCFNPFALLDVGFQLSYLALLGILFFQEKIYRFWYIKNKLGNWLWKLVSVGIAAQITTFPISIFYFHQFPLYFMLSGIIVVPAAMVILGLGITLLVTNSIPFIGAIVGQCLSIIIWVVNTLIFSIANLPFSVIGEIWVDPMMLILLYVMIIAMMVLLTTYLKKWIWVVVMTLLSSGCWNAWQSFRKIRQDEIVFYYQQGNSIIEFFSGRKVFSFKDHPVHPEELGFINQNYHWYQKVDSVEEYNLNDFQFNQPDLWGRQGFFQFHNKKMLVLDSNLHEQPIKVDLVLVKEKQYINFEKRQSQLQPDLWVFSPSAPYWLTRKWALECEELGLNCHDINKDGALAIKVEK